MITTGATAISSLISGLVGLLVFAFWLWMLIDCLTNSRLKGADKIVWALVIIFLPCIGSLIYYFIGRKR
jgi:hypothetical protein